MKLKDKPIQTIRKEFKRLLEKYGVYDSYVNQTIKDSDDWDSTPIKDWVSGNFTWVGSDEGYDLWDIIDYQWRKKLTKEYKSKKAITKL